jgi:hypothetical protein
MFRRMVTRMGLPDLRAIIPPLSQASYACLFTNLGKQPTSVFSPYRIADPGHFVTGDALAAFALCLHRDKSFRTEVEV